MKTLKKILIGVAILIAIPLIAALFIKKDYVIEREITIDKPKQDVFNYIKLIKNQDNFSKWSMMDPAMKKGYKGTDGTVGFVSAWDSNNKDVGKGEQEITAITEGEKIEVALRFIEPFAGTASAYFSTGAVSENQTKVKWSFSGSTPYPFNFMCLFMNMDEMIGSDLGTGLSNLKGVLEKQ